MTIYEFTKLEGHSIGNNYGSPKFPTNISNKTLCKSKTEDPYLET